MFGVTMVFRCLLPVLLVTLSCARGLDQLAPFPCAVDGTCPSGFMCVSNTCQRRSTSVATSDANDAPVTPPDTDGDPAPSDVAEEVTAAAVDGSEAPAPDMGRVLDMAADMIPDMTVARDMRMSADMADGPEVSMPVPAFCSSDGDCGASYYCTGNKCLARRPDGSACVANAECSSRTCKAYYFDGDRDGYGSVTVVTRCGATAPTGGVVDYAEKSGDCCDRDPQSHPGGGFVTGLNACGSWDNNCDGVTEKVKFSTDSCCKWSKVKEPGGVSTGYAMECIPTPTNPPTPPCFVFGPPAADCGQSFSYQTCEGNSEATCGLKYKTTTVQCR